MDSSVVALVPIKEHSERVPEKNFREFNGRPLYHWILHTLEATEAVDDIVVNTDSEELVESIPREFDARTLERPAELRGDTVSMNEIILHDVEQVDADVYLQTHCTNPLLRPETVQEAAEKFISSSGHDSLFSVTPIQTRLWNADVEPINHRRDELKRTQDLPPVYEENSNMYFFTQSSVTSRQNRIGDSPMIFEMEAEEAIDIDYPIDFRTAEFLHRDRYGDNPAVNQVIE